jgi:hypothetical protein
MGCAPIKETRSLKYVGLHLKASNLAFQWYFLTIIKTITRMFQVLIPVLTTSRPFQDVAKMHWLKNIRRTLKRPIVNAPLLQRHPPSVPERNGKEQCRQQPEIVPGQDHDVGIRATR